MEETIRDAASRAWDYDDPNNRPPNEVSLPSEALLELLEVKHISKTRMCNTSARTELASAQQGRACRLSEDSLLCVPGYRGGSERRFRVSGERLGAEAGGHN
eukprot:jgi/Tetstr1/458025/TSEL_044534.t1